MLPKIQLSIRITKLAAKPKDRENRSCSKTKILQLKEQSYSKRTPCQVCQIFMKVEIKRIGIISQLRLDNELGWRELEISLIGWVFRTANWKRMMLLIQEIIRQGIRGLRLTRWIEFANLRNILSFQLRIYISQCQAKNSINIAPNQSHLWAKFTKSMTKKQVNQLKHSSNVDQIQGKCNHWVSTHQQR